MDLGVTTTKGVRIDANQNTFTSNKILTQTSSQFLQLRFQLSCSLMLTSWRALLNSVLLSLMAFWTQLIWDKCRMLVEWVLGLAVFTLTTRYSKDFHYRIRLHSFEYIFTSWKYELILHIRRVTIAVLSEYTEYIQYVKYKNKICGRHMQVFIIDTDIFLKELAACNIINKHITQNEKGGVRYLYYIIQQWNMLMKNCGGARTTSF